jgi:translation initiation factor 2 beta subunit (eIF-2beta)/eIF-5
MTKPRIDPGLEEIRRVRPEISEEIGRDPGRLLEYYKRGAEGVR